MTGDKIRQMYNLMDLGLDKFQIAEKVGVSFGQVSNYKRLRPLLDNGDLPQKNTTTYSMQGCTEYIQKYVRNSYSEAHNEPAEPREENRRIKYKMEVIVWEYQ